MLVWNAVNRFSFQEEASRPVGLRLFPRAYGAYGAYGFVIRSLELIQIGFSVAVSFEMFDKVWSLSKSRQLPLFQRKGAVGSAGVLG